MVTHSMDNILNMQYYPTNSHVDAAVHSPPLRKRRCLNKEVILFPLVLQACGINSFWRYLWKVVCIRWGCSVFFELLQYRVFLKGHLVIEGNLGVENASGGFFEDLSM